MHRGETEKRLKGLLAQARNRIAELDRLVDSMRMEAEGRFQGSEEIVRTLFDSSLESIFFIDTSGIVLNANGITAQRLEGRPSSGIIGRCMYDLMPPGIAEACRTHVEQVIRKGKPVRFQDQWEGKWLDSAIYPIRDAEGRTVRLLIFVKDHTEHKRMEAALKESEHRFATFMDNSPAMAWMKDEEGRYVYFNKTYETVTGIQTTHRLGRTDDELWPPETAEQFKKNDREVLSGGQPVQVIEETVEPDGKRRYAFNSKFIFTDADGKKYVAGIGVDITDAKRAEERLSQALQRLDAHMNNSPLAVIEFDPEFHVTRWSNEAERIFGWKSEEIIGRSISEMRWIYEEDAPLVRRISDEMKHAARVSFKNVNRNYRKDGAVILCEWYNSAIYDADGRLASILSSVLDVTKRHQAEEELSKANARLEGRADELELRVRERTTKLRDSYDRLRLEMDERKRFESLLAETRNLAVKLSATSDLHEALDLCLDAALQTGEMDFGGIYLLDPDTDTLRLQVHRNLPQTFVDQVSVLGRDSSIAPFVTAGRPVYHTYGELNLPFDFPVRIRGVAILPILAESGVVGFLNVASGTTDFIPLSLRVALEMIAAQIGGALERITSEQKRTRLEQQLRQAQKMEAIGTLAGGIAHDFNNILAAILGNAELAMDDVEETGSVRQNLNHIVKSSIRARDLVRQILTFSRISDQEQKPLHLVPVIEEAFQFLRASLPATIETTLEASLRDDVVIGNEGQIQQIIMNLVTNAKQAISDGGHIEISLQDASLPDSIVPDRVGSHDYILISVRDTGSGMDESVRPRIFEPFFTTRETGQGTGLGLPVVYGIVASHGGFVAVESEPGKGSTMKVFLPKANVRVESSLEPVNEMPHGKEHILFVDDEESLCLLIDQRLSRLGYRVTTAASGEEALHLFARNPDDFDLVITDQTMPVMTGLGLSRELLRIRPDLPIILCTGYSERANKDIAKEVGIREFLMKPITQKELAETVRRVLDRESADDLTASGPSLKNRRFSP